MTTRRSFTCAALSSVALISSGRMLWSQEVQAPPDDEIISSIEDIDYPSFEKINPVNQFGSSEPEQWQVDRAKAIWSNAPKGPHPMTVAEYFVDNFYATEPDAISQWPRADAWNPLIVEFFRATSYRAENDMVPWCAAFVNWCLRRTNRIDSGSAASQSFIWDPTRFQAVNTPSKGDLAVFTCYSKTDGKSVGLGHVAFVDTPPPSGATHISVLGGNQTSSGRSMICRARYPLTAVSSSRMINGVRTPVTFKFNTYIRIV